MKANELRIGNWIKYPNWNRDNSDKFFMARELYWFDNKIGLTDANIRTETELDIIRPIPLTEEWLLNKTEFIITKPKDGIAAAYLYKGIRVYMSNSGNFYYKKRVLFGVHDLQNLVHAMLDEELEIKL